MANVQGKFYTSETQRRGVTPSSPPNAEDDPQDPVSPSSPVSFITLTDTPSSYSGQTLKGVRVNAGETGLEFYTITSGGLPPIDGSYASQALMIADQANQTAQYIYFDGTEYWEYLGTTTPSIADYRAISTSTGGSFISYAVAQGLTGTQRQQGLDNIGDSAGSVETFNNVGVVTLNNLVITKSNIQFTGSSTVTLTGLVPLWDGQEVVIYNETGNNLVISRDSASSSALNRVNNGIIIGTRQTAVIKYTDLGGSKRWIIISGGFFFSSVANNFSTLLEVGFNTAAVTNVAGTFRSFSDTVATSSIRSLNLTGTTLFEVTGASLRSNIASSFGGFAPEAGVALGIKPISFDIALRVYNVSSSRVIDLIGSTGNWQSLGGAFFGASSTATVPTARVDIRGRGTTTGITLLLEDSAGTDNVRFVDNGKVQFLRLPTSSAGLAAGDLWNNAGVINIV